MTTGQNFRFNAQKSHQPYAPHMLCKSEGDATEPTKGYGEKFQSALTELCHSFISYVHTVKAYYIYIYIYTHTHLYGEGPSTVETYFGLTSPFTIPKLDLSKFALVFNGEPRIGSLTKPTMRKKLHQNQHYRWRIFILGLMCITLTILLLQANYMPHLRLNYFDPPAKPKIAFLFIARNRLPLDFVWQRFFQGAEGATFSIYIHSRPGFIYNKATTSCTYFYRRQLSDSIQVDWGEASMLQAERILLRKALQDPANQRFILVSDSCVPLYNFSYTYDYVMSSTESFVDSFSDTKEGRYNPKMSGTIPVEKWRKGSQWATLIRKHAEVIVADDTVFPVFQLHCKRKPLPEFWREEGMTGDTSKIHNCIPDEHYVQTLLAMHGLEGEINHRTLTYTQWKSGTGKARERQGWHPMTFKLSDATANLIKDIKGIDHVYYETEYRTEWCNTSGKFSPCFLFARKFSRVAALRLLNQSMLGNY